MSYYNNCNRLWLIYQKLFNFYGPLNWWPGKNKLEIMLGAILTQNTSWKNVTKTIKNMEEKGLIDIEALFNIEVDLLGEIIRSSGYYNIKARRLKSFINFLCQNYNGSIEEMFSVDWKNLREELLRLNGIGPETADSILLYAGEKPVFVVDTYTRRIFHRHNCISFRESYEKIQHFFMAQLPPNHLVYNEFHAQIVMVGKDFCKKNNPNCKDCPLNSFLA